MPKDPIDITDIKESLKAAKPAILKCSYNFARKIKKEKHRITDPRISRFLSTLQIKPTDKIPSHLIFLCDKHGNTIRMINLTTPAKTKAEKPIIIH